MRIRYTCDKYPSLGIGNGLITVRFENGELVTDNPAEQALVEGAARYPYIRREVIIEEKPSEVAGDPEEIVGVEPEKPKRVYRKRKK